MDRGLATRFFGGSPSAVLMRLVAVSFVLGVILSALGVSPFDIINSLRDLFWRIYSLGWESIEWIVRYFLLGAVIVFPVWLIVRLVKMSRRRDAS
jgi:RsiW-degrading membrane proteinase PrsW (M82 family)